MKSLDGVLMFHLNLCYSSIEVERRGEVVRACYWPLLRLLDRLPDLRIALEASGHTLELVDELDTEWTARLRELVAQGRVELVGSGDTQLIGPLVPASVNGWNQRLGQEGYERLVGVRPRVALVNEMAWSQGMVDHYLDAGYAAVLMEWNNPRLSHPEWSNELRYGPVRTPAPSGREIDLLWVDTTAFQKFQRVVCEEIDQDEYREWILGHRGSGRRVLFLYANDAEIFDFRPGRYDTEPRPAEASEWARIEQVLRGVMEDGLTFKTPGQVLEEHAGDRPCVVLSSAADPVPVKKQPKYNVTRWALSGRDDVGVNAACFARCANLERDGGGSEEWRQLCRQWGSDQRTHLTEARWKLLCQSLADVRRVTAPGSGSEGSALREPARIERRGRRLEVATAGVDLTLNTRRGLAIEAARFAVLGDRPVLGTLEHGFFDHIHWTADFYSGHTVAEVPGHRRVADLQAVEPVVLQEVGALRVRTEVPTAMGPLGKELVLEDERLTLSVDFSAWGERPAGSLRTAILTLHPELVDEGLWIECRNGGLPERFEVRPPCDHGRGTSPFVSASAAFGASEGPLVLHTVHGSLALEWDRTLCAALPLLTCVEVDGRWLTRLSFSLSEMDDTHRAGARLPERFSLTLTPRAPGPHDPCNSSQ